MNWPLVISALVTVIVGVIFLAMLVETIAFATRHKPITWFTRKAIIRWPIQATVLSMIVTALWAHFFWDRYCQ